MASLGGNLLPPNMTTSLYIAGSAIAVLVGGIAASTIFAKPAAGKDENPGFLRALWIFVYSCFLKPHSGDKKGTQQDALESFYKTQAGVYDATRHALLKGREDMLALAAAQLEARKNAEQQQTESKRRIWVDVCFFTNTLESRKGQLANPGENRLVAALATTSKPWADSSMFQPSSRASISSTSPLLFAMLPASDSLVWAGTT
jgi:7,8-dihydro-6-hydroxymethylpterin-pyrophosphokinase